MLDHGGSIYLYDLIRICNDMSGKSVLQPLDPHLRWLNPDFGVYPNKHRRKVDVSAKHQEPVTGPRGREGQMPFLVEFVWDIPRDFLTNDLSTKKGWNQYFFEVTWGELSETTCCRKYQLIVRCIVPVCCSNPTIRQALLAIG